MSEILKNQSNPFSTGGGGVNFETRVQASFAVSLFTQSSVPCLSLSMTTQEIKFQNKYDGSNTDDFVLTATDKDQHQQKSQLYAQIKHEIAISDSSESMFSEVIQNAWEDFSSDQFNSQTDSIALITGPLSKGDIKNVLPLLEWAKHASCADDFIKKANKKGFTSHAKIKKLGVFRSQLNNANRGSDVTDDELWLFLRVFYLVSYDLDSEHSVVARMLSSQIGNHSKELPSLVLSRIITCAQEFNQNAGVLNLSSAPKDVISLFDLSNSQRFDSDIYKLRERGDYIFSGISNAIKGFHVNREEQLNSISSQYYESDFIFVTGARGVGKSGIVKDFVVTKSKDVPVFYFRAEDLDKSHLNEVFTAIGMSSTLGQIASKFSLLREKILVIESVEKVLELTYQNAFVDLLRYIGRQKGWTVIATGRDYAYQQLVFNYLQPSDIGFSSVNIEGFNAEQIDEICERMPELQALMSNERLSDLLKIPFFVELAVRAMENGAQFQAGDTEADFRTAVWASVISNESYRKSGMPVKRKKAFIEIAKERAKQMVFGIRDAKFDPEVILKLEEDDLIKRDSKSSMISPSHDVLEDWALEEFIEEEYLENSSNPSEFFSSVGCEPSISRAFRLWLCRRLRWCEDIEGIVSQILSSDSVESYWKDETIAAILQSGFTTHFLKLLKFQLLKDDCLLLIRFFFILRITCQRPNSNFNQDAFKDKKSGLVQSLLLQPYGDGWESLINFAYDHRNDLDDSVSTHIIEVLVVWVDLININDALPQASTKVGLLALWLLEPLKDCYRNEGKGEKILGVLLKVSPAIQSEFDELMDRDVFVAKRTPRRLEYVDEMSSLALNGINVPFLCKHRPEFVIKLALNEWLLENAEDDDFYDPSMMDVDECFGLDDARDFFPPSGAKGPFRYLLRYHPRLALDFIIELCSTTAQNYSESEFANPSSSEARLILSSETEVKKVELHLNDGSTVKQYASPHLWKGYRGLSTLPYLLQSALMALEEWMVDYVTASEGDSEIEEIYDYILKTSNSVMTTSVLASVATGFSSKVGCSSFPILKCPELYHLDLQRMTGEMGGSEINWFASSINRDPMANIYVEERRKAALKPWRKESLETLLVRLQIEDGCREGALEILDDLIKFSLDNHEESLRFMVHRVDTRAWEAVEDRENERVVFESKQELPEDLKQVQKEHEHEHRCDDIATKLRLWSRKLFEENIFMEKYCPTYDDALEKAKCLLDVLKNGEANALSGLMVGCVATTVAVCIRDVFSDLSAENKELCKEVVIESVNIHANVRDEIATHNVTDYAGAGACAFVLPKLLEYELDEEKLRQIKLSLVMSLTHENLNVCTYAAKGVREFLWSIDPAMASHCLSGIIRYARFREEECKSRIFYHMDEDEREQAEGKWNSLIINFRNGFFRSDPELLVDKISLQTHSSWFLHLPMLMIPLGTEDDNQVALIRTLVELVYEGEYRDHRASEDKKISHDIKRKIQDCFAEHVIHSRVDEFWPVRELLRDGCTSAPSIVYSLKLSFDVAMEKESEFDSVWSLWSVLAPEAHKIALNDVSERYSGRQNDLNRLLRGMLYADCPWQGHEKEEKVIEYGAKHLLDFAKISGNNSHVFEALASLMYQFYKVFFQEGIYILAEKYDQDSELIVRQVNTAFYLEMSIGRYLQIENRGVLSRKMYGACIGLLTGVVETGSARAYYLRENLVRSRRVSQ